MLHGYIYVLWMEIDDWERERERDTHMGMEKSVERYKPGYHIVCVWVCMMVEEGEENRYGGMWW